MGISSSSYGTSQDYIPPVAASERWKFAGLGSIQFATLADLNASVVKERANITANGSGLWPDGQEFRVATEADVGRKWSVSLNHARTVVLSRGKTVVLVGDSNTVYPATGAAPASGTGTTGDVGVDWANGNYYVKADATTWGAAVNFAANSTSGAAGSNIQPTQTATAALSASAHNATTPYNSASAGVLTLPPAAGAWASKPYGIVYVPILAAGIPTFAPAGSDTLIAPAGVPLGVQGGHIAAQIRSATSWVLI